MQLTIRRALTTAVMTTAILMLFASAAFAHFCYNASRSTKGNQGASNSAAWVPAEDILRNEIGLCDEGIEHVLAGAAALGYPQPLLVHGRTVMASGVAGTEHSFDGRGIDHLDFGEIDPLVEEAFGICFGA